MAKTNYSFDKRQKEIAKKKKNEEKRLKKITKSVEVEPEQLAGDETPTTDSDT